MGNVQTADMSRAVTLPCLRYSEYAPHIAKENNERNHISYCKRNKTAKEAAMRYKQNKTEKMIHHLQINVN